MSSKDDPKIALDLPDNLDDFTFDEWCALHDADPERFDACRLKMLNDLIDSAAEDSKPRLRGLMFRMEGEARRSGSQLGYNLRLSSMMMEMLDELREQLHLLCTADAAEFENSTPQSNAATVIPFSRADRKDD